MHEHVVYRICIDAKRSERKTAKIPDFSTTFQNFQAANAEEEKQRKFHTKRI